MFPRNDIIFSVTLAFPFWQEIESKNKCGSVAKMRRHAVYYTRLERVCATGPIPRSTYICIQRSSAHPADYLCIYYTQTERVATVVWESLFRWMDQTVEKVTLP